MENSIILASSSPRRSELLTRAGVDFRVLTCETDESFPEKMAPQYVVKILAVRKTMLSFLTAGVKAYPKVQINKRVKDADRVLEQEQVKQVVAAAERELAGRGRVLIRKSGTEPVIRVLVEADEQELCAGLAERIGGVIEECGL